MVLAFRAECIDLDGAENSQGHGEVIHGRIVYTNTMHHITATCPCPLPLTKDVVKLWGKNYTLSVGTSLLNP